ncbi:MAG: tRNA (N(6)-L-threonylcarbamoyladenosine(37)-C(2))-methylthiotransferase MtaB [Acidobacteriota bacterium]
MIRRFYLHTLGCKLNQADTSILRRALTDRGMEPARRPEDADLMVVNTCTVTGRADVDGRKILRRLARLNPTACLVAAGCYARRAPAELERIPGVALVAGGSNPSPILRQADTLFAGQLIRRMEPYHAQPGADGRTRAYLKIQDGCNLSCSYCIIPAVRGRSRSIPPEELEESLRRLIACGFKEIVLTGVNSGDYGRDLPGRIRLLDLLERLVRVPGLGRLRLNSLEPRTINLPLMEFLAATRRVAPHLQIPLQSGSDRILARMRRNYRCAEYLDLLARLAARIPHVGLGADIIVGFPGEGEREFAETVDLVQAAPLTYLHVFSYSSLPGTDAARLGGTVSPQAIARRSAHLRDLARVKTLAFAHSQMGRTLEAVTLSAGPRGLRALTGNFLHVQLPRNAAAANRLVKIQLTAAGDTGLEGIRVA